MVSSDRLSHGPDGGVWITDFYREIIEDYSAIPRYLQQQYGVTNGKDHGRIWRLTADGTSSVPQDTPSSDMSRLSVDELALEVGSDLFWRRQTARRLLTDHTLTDVEVASAVLRSSPWLSKRATRRP